MPTEGAISNAVHIYASLLEKKQIYRFFSRLGVSWPMAVGMLWRICFYTNLVPLVYSYFICTLKDKLFLMREENDSQL